MKKKRKKSPSEETMTTLAKKRLAKRMKKIVKPRNLGRRKFSNSERRCLSNIEILSGT